MNKKPISVILHKDLEDMLEIKIENWNGVVYKISRNIIKNNKISEIERPGVYLLICENDSDNKNQVYIGESENVYKRLRNHLNKYEKNEIEYYWVHCYVFAGNDFDKALIRYIEKRLYDEAEKAKRYKILTEKTTSNPIINDFKKYSCEEYIKNSLEILNVLEIDIFRIVQQRSNNEVNEQDISSINYSSNNNEFKYMKIKSTKANAYGYESSNGFVVIKGSSISEKVTDTFDKYYKSKNRLRNELIERKVIVNNKFTMDYEFTSPNAAFILITGMGSGHKGIESWKYVDKVEL